MSKKEKLKPILDEKITKVLNLTVLQRVDPCVRDIITTASHVAFYELNTDTVVWKRKNVQGTLFVVKRSAQPWYQFLVMNRLHTENLVESLVGDFEYEVHGPYLLYRNHSQEINGIWFYNANDCEEIANLFSRILDEYSKVSTKSSPIKSKVEKDASLEPSSTATFKAADVVDDQSFVNISSMHAAMNFGTSTHSTISGQPCQSYTALAPLRSTDLDTLLLSPVPAALSPSSSIISILTKKCPDSDLVKPTSFSCPRPSPSIMQPIISSVPTVSALIFPGNLKRPYGALLLQPFAPPTSPQSLTPASVPTPNYEPILSTEKVRKALQLLVQDNQFIDIVYRATLNAPEG